MACHAFLGKARVLRYGFASTALALIACGHTREVEKRFEHEYECSDVEVQQISDSTFQARGCGAEAMYTCAGHVGEASVCVREYTDHELRRMTAPAPVVAAPSGVEGPGSVQRVFDEERKLHVVRVTFKAARLGADVTFLGAPEHELTAVYLQMKIRGAQSKYRNCTSLRVVVNGEPFDGAGVKVESPQTATTLASGRFEFEVFKPLARKYPQFGIEVCNQQITFGEGQVANLTKFLEIFSQIALDTQAKGGGEGKPAVQKNENALEL